MSEERMAPEGSVWVCAACGKTARDRYGIVGEHSHGWDESCALNAVLRHQQKHFNAKGELVWWAAAEPLPATGPVRERAIKEIVPGVYGRVGVSSPYDGKVRVHFVAPDYVTAQLGAELTATELTDAIATLTAIRDAMEDKP